MTETIKISNVYFRIRKVPSQILHYLHQYTTLLVSLSLRYKIRFFKYCILLSFIGCVNGLFVAYMTCMDSTSLEKA